MWRAFDGERLSRKCCTGLWILGLATYQKIFFLHKSIAIYLKGFTNSDLDHKGNHHTLWTLRIKGHGEDKHLRSVHCIVIWGKRPRSATLDTGADSQLNTYKKSADWVALQTGLKSQSRALPGMVSMSYRHLRQSLRQKEACRDPTAEAGHGHYRGCFVNLRVLILPWLLNMRRRSKLYPGSKTPGVRQLGPEQDCNIISR